MMKSAEDAISKIPILKCEGRQNLDFAAWKKSFATSMGQRYGELAQFYRTGEAFTHSMRPWSTGRKNQMPWKWIRWPSTGRRSCCNIQLSSELYNKLHEDVCKKLTDDHLWEEVERKQDSEGLVIAVTKIMTLVSSGNKHQDTHRARMMHHAIRQNDKKSLQDYYSRTTRILATQHPLGNKLDPDIDLAMNFTYKLDRNIFQTMIMDMDWLEESEIRKH